MCFETMDGCSLSSAVNLHTGLCVISAHWRTAVMSSC